MQQVVRVLDVRDIFAIDVPLRAELLQMPCLEHGRHQVAKRA